MSETNSCEECGFSDEGVTPADVVVALRSFGKRSRGVEVADALAANAERFAATIETVPADGWGRVHLRRGEPRTVLFTGRRAAHEGNHHLLDIGRGLRAVREAR